MAPAPELDALYRQWLRPLLRWLLAMGVPRADVEDVAQEVFMVVQRRLDDFDGESPGPWIYGVALRVASNHRRRAWVRRILYTDTPPEPEHTHTPPTPEKSLAERQLLVIADEVLANLSDKLRRVYVLFEIEGVSGEEISVLERIPVPTVWTRLHEARKKFAEHAVRVRKKRGLQ